MNQLDAFVEPPRPRNQRAVRIVRQRAAQRATDHADADSPTWSQRAYAALQRFAAQRDGEFLAEEAIYWMTHADGLPEPADKRAFGSVFTRAARAGVIRRVGWSTNTKNCSAKPTYLRGAA